MTSASSEMNHPNAIRALAVSTYELGHQPLVLARLAGTFKSAGVDYALLDNSVANRTFANEEDFFFRDEAPTHLFISVPMHTATRLGKEIATRARAALGNSVKIIAVGLYSNVAVTSSDAFDSAIVSVDNQKVLDALGIQAKEGASQQSKSSRPDRSELPGLANYAHLISAGEKQLVGYVETTVGCAHMCRHCPVPVAFNGKFKAVPANEVLGQIDQLYEEGARHITFGDPDFLNGPAHALRIVRAMHEIHPDLTFDATVKVEHVLEHPEIWAKLPRLGLKFIVSAFEHTSDEILTRLGKGHSRSDIVAALALLRENGVEVRPSLMPFTPWTDRDSLIDLIEFLFDYDLLESIDPVQLTIRLLVPLGSLVLADSGTEFGRWNSELLSYEWANTDPVIDQLQSDLAAIAEESQAIEQDAATTFNRMRDAIYASFDLAPPMRSQIPSTCSDRPRLSESWFCCAEPTKVQLDRLG